jgi:hypothetical protein
MAEDGLGAVAADTFYNPKSRAALALVSAAICSGVLQGVPCKKIFLFFTLLVIGFGAFAQSIDKSQYKEIDLFSYIVESRQIGKDYAVKYKIVLKFNYQRGTIIVFADDAGDYIGLVTTKRWPLKRGQFVTVYLSANHKSSGYWSEEKLDDLETSTASSVKPWLPYVSNGKTGLHGWYLQDMGNGTYKEVYFGK